MKTLQDYRSIETEINNILESKQNDEKHNFTNFIFNLFLSLRNECKTNDEKMNLDRAFRNKFTIKTN